MNHRKKKPKHWADIVIVLVFFVGLAIFAYPFVAQAVNHLTIASRLQHDLARSKDRIQKQLDAAEKQNAHYAKYGLAPNADVFYERGKGRQERLPVQKHLIGAVTIPKIAAKLPLYSKASEQLLQQGAVVVPGTSWPRGGKSTHTVISAHSGLPSKRFFTDLDDLEKGDRFILTVNDQKLAYQIFRRQVVEPDATEHLKIAAGQDLATLLTCVPIGINSHRLLVTGRRVPYTQADDRISKERLRQKWWQSFGMIIGVIVLTGFLIWWLRHSHKNRRERASR